MSNRPHRLTISPSYSFGKWGREAKIVFKWMSTFDDTLLQELAQIRHSIRKRAYFSHFRHQRLAPPKLVKVAFDTRRVNQNLDFNPRRNLQYYQRSEPYMDAQTADKVQLFFKVKIAADLIREQFLGEPDWLDSHTRILCNALDETLRIDQKDFDYSYSRLGYLEELLYVRYRLRPEDILRHSQDELRDIFFKKDERLVHRGVFVNYKQDLTKKGNPEVLASSDLDLLVDRLFGNTKISKDNKDVERSVHITIRDRIIDGIDKKG